MSGPSPHLSWNELACWNRRRDASGHPIKWQGFAPGQLIAGYPMELREDPLVQLAATFEDVRAALGDYPLTVTSGYRTVGYNKAVGGARRSQHLFGRALDFTHPKMSPDDVYVRLRKMYAAGTLPFLGGLGCYARWTHIDVRVNEPKRLAVWFGHVEK